jgi:hypothetical protein
VAEAKAAIAKRLQVISQSEDHHAECQAIEDALRALRVLKQELQSTPAPRPYSSPDKSFFGGKWRQGQCV